MLKFSSLTATLSTVAVLLCQNAAQAQKLHVKTFSSTDTFTIPSGTTSDLQFEFTSVGGGGGGTGCDDHSTYAGGGAGGVGISVFKGFSAGDVLTLTVGTGGAGGSNGNTTWPGSNGTATKVTYKGHDIITAEHGGGGNSNGGGTSGNYDVTAAAGLTLVSSLALGSQPGHDKTVTSGSVIVVGAGGSNSLGVGGYPEKAGKAGGGGGSCANTVNGGSGGDGFVIVRWVL